MLENCKNIVECENNLLAALKGIEYLGQMAFTAQDITALATFLREKLQTGREGRKLLESIPACVSVYLLGMGMMHYQSGEFWPAVEKDLSLSGTNSFEFMGEIFLKFIASQGLYRVNIKDAHKYVTPILLHGGLPYTCYKEFYHRVVRHFINNNMWEENEVREELAKIRANTKSRKQLLEGIALLEAEVGSLEKEYEHLSDILDIIKQKNDLEQNMADVQEYMDLPSDYNQFISESKAHQKLLYLAINQLIQQKKKFQKAEQNSAGALTEIAVQSAIDVGKENIDQIRNVQNLNNNFNKVSLCRIIPGLGLVILGTGLLFATMPVPGYTSIFTGLLLLLTRNIKQQSKEVPNLEAITQVAAEKEHLDLVLLDQDKAVSQPQQMEYEEILVALDQSVYSLKQINKKIQDVQSRLIQLGKGNLEQGIKIWREKQAAWQRLQDIEKNLARQIAALPGNVKNEHEIGEMYNEKSRVLNTKKNELAERKKKLENYPAYFENTDEPVQRFIYYGGEWTVQWLCAFINWHRYCMGENVDTANWSKILPRVWDKLPELVMKRPTGNSTGTVEQKSATVEQTGAVTEQKSARAERAGATVEQKSANTEQAGVTAEQNSASTEQIDATVEQKRTSAEKKSTVPPRLCLDHVQRKVFVYLAGGFFPADRAGVPEVADLIVTSLEEPTKCHREQLNIYLNSDSIEIKPVHVYPEFPAAMYEVVLDLGYEVYRWEIEAFNIPYLLFDEQGEKLKPQLKPGKIAWVLLLQELELEPASSLIASDELYLGEQTYPLLLIHAQPEAPTKLVDRNTNTSYNISSARPISPDPYLKETEPSLIKFPVCDRPVYTGRLPVLCVLADDPDEQCPAWKLDIQRQTAAGNYQTICEQINILNQGDRADDCWQLELDSWIGEHPLGEYKLTLTRPGWQTVNLTMLVLPGLQFSFAREAYFPARPGEQVVELTLNIPQQLASSLHVETSEPARIITSDHTNIVIQTEWEARKISLQLVYHGEEKLCYTPLTIDIPCIRWRITGTKEQQCSDWSLYTREVWYKLWDDAANPYLEIEVPEQLSGRWKVYLAEVDRQLYAVNPEERVKRFKLSQLADAWRGGEEIYSLHLALEDEYGHVKVAGKIIDIRCRWRVDNIQCSTLAIPDDTIFQVTWEERGREENRLVQLWPLWEPWITPITSEIPAGQTHLEMRLKEFALRPGPYMLRITADNPWREDEQIVFPQDNIHCQQVLISDNNEQIAIIVDNCRWENEQTLIVDGRLLGVQSPQDILFYHYSVPNDRVSTRRVKATTDQKGYFSHPLPAYQEHSLAGKRTKRIRSHWLGIVVAGEMPVYHFQMLPQPGPLWFPFTLNSDWLDFVTVLAGQIFIDNPGLNQPLLTPEESQRISHHLMAGRESMTTLKFNNEKKKARLYCPKNGGSVNIALEDSAIKCTTCGKIEPDHDAWRTNHPRCKGFILNYKEIDAELFWYFELSPILEQWCKKYQLAGNQALVLYNSLLRPLPEPATVDIAADRLANSPAKLIRLLWQKELHLLMGKED